MAHNKIIITQLLDFRLDDLYVKEIFSTVCVKPNIHFTSSTQSIFLFEAFDILSVAFDSTQPDNISSKSLTSLLDSSINISLYTLYVVLSQHRGQTIQEKILNTEIIGVTNTSGFVFVSTSFFFSS